MAEAKVSFHNALLASDSTSAAAIMDKYLESNTVFSFIDQVVVKALDDIGQGWHSGEYALSQVYMSGKISEDLLEKVLPDESGLRKKKPTAAIALLNDYHALGKRIVYAVLRASGFELIDYGRVETKTLVEKVREDGIEVLLISVLMLSSALQVKDVIKGLKSSQTRVKVIVGGAPFRLDHELWQIVGADAVGYSASDALHLINHLEGEPDNG